MNKSYMLFSSFKRDIFTLVFPQGMAEHRVPLFRNFVVNGLIQLQTYVESYQDSNVSFYDKDQSFDDCGLSVIQACRGQIGAVYAFKPSCRCTRYFYDSASLEKLSCFYEACRCAQSGCTPRSQFSLSDYTRDPAYCGYNVYGNDGCRPPYLTAEPEEDCAFKLSDKNFAIGPGNKLWLWPRFPCGYLIGVHWRGIRRSYLDTDYILDDEDLKDCVAAYVESEVARRVDKDQATADKVYADYRLKAGDIIFREERDLKPRTTRLCVEGLDVSELVQIYPDNPYPTYVGYQCAQKKTESIEPLIPEFDSECQETFRFSWLLEEPFVDGSDILQAASSAAGPWYDYITVVPTADQLTSGEVVVAINNSFNGQRLFRLVRNGAVFRDMTRPAPSMIPMPTNIAVSNTTTSPFPLHMTGPFVRPISSLENPFINPTNVYVEPVGRLEYGWNETWDGIPTVVSLTAASGTTAKWTRDGSDPTVGMQWPPPVYESVDYNARVYQSDFAMAIRARCFSGECRSPLSLVLVDIRYQALYMAREIGEGVSVFSSCDLPRVIGGVTVESGQSCAIYHGGTTTFSAGVNAFACAHLTGPSGISGAHRLYQTIKGEGIGTSWGGWPAFFASRSKWFMTSFVPTTYRKVSYWRNASAVYEYAMSSFSPASPFKALVAGPGISGGHLAGASGTLNDHTSAVGGYLLSFVPACIIDVNAQVDLVSDDFEVLRSLQNDVSFNGPPLPAVDPQPPHVTDVFGDDFEAYLDTHQAELEVLNSGTGWGGQWHFIVSAIIVSEDDMQSYSDGAVIDTADADPFLDPVYNGGVGWDSSWTFTTDQENVIGGDDFESYTDGAVLVGNLNLGSRWDADSFWMIHPGMELGGDDFEDYADGVITSGALNLGDRWISAGWTVT